MAYQVGGTNRIKDDNTVVFKNVTVKNHYAFAPLGPVQGTTSGYTSGGQRSPSTPPVPAGHNEIDKFPFAVDLNATDVGDLSETGIQRQTSGSSSSSNGYVAGGSGTISNPGRKSKIDKFPFSSDTNASNIGDLVVATDFNSGNSSSTHGYSAGGGKPPPGPPYVLNVIEKYSFSSDGNASDVGDLLQEQYRQTGQSSPSHGYASGGYDVPYTAMNVIQKFTFASDANATDVGDLVTNNAIAEGGNSSLTHGYIAGGSPNLNLIEKFPFSSDTNASDVGDLTQGRAATSGNNSGVSGYVTGGLTHPPFIGVDTIDKFPFSTDANASDVGNLTIARNSMSGQQV